MPTYKLVIAYDGTDYNGWQEQPGLPTLEGLFKESLNGIFKQEIPFPGASRTDTGVHAQGQVGRCILPMNLEPDHLQRVLNQAMPQGVHVRSVKRVNDAFHPRVHVLEKTYYYHFFTELPSPFLSRFGVYRKKIAIEQFKKALALFVGTHDFRSFCTGDQGRTTIRTIKNIELEYFKEYGMYRVAIQGPSFLRHMIRRIIGACFDVASNKATCEQLIQALEQKDPEQHLYVAPAKGLLLQDITYTD